MKQSKPFHSFRRSRRDPSRIEGLRQVSCSVLQGFAEVLASKQSKRSSLGVKVALEDQWSQVASCVVGVVEERKEGWNADLKTQQNKTKK